MAEEHSILPPSKAFGWAAIAVLVVVAVTMYFVFSPAVPPLTEPAAVDATAAP